MSHNWAILELSALGEKTINFELIRDSLMGLGAGVVFVPAVSQSMDKQISLSYLFEGYTFARVGIPSNLPEPEPLWNDAGSIGRKTGNLSGLIYKILCDNRGCDLSCNELMDEVARRNPKILCNEDSSRNYRVVYTAARRVAEIQFGGNRFWVPCSNPVHPKELEASPYINRVMSSEYVDGKKRKLSKVSYVSDSDITQYRRSLLKLIPVFCEGQRVTVTSGVYRQMTGEVLRYSRDMVQLKIALRTLSVDVEVPPLFLEAAPE